ncbi:MAG TPA: hypothetical protein PKJ95_03130, partial [Atribacterota bacterium]|nr:hypothetical protein [Atribacterota bacterium]
MNRLKIKKMLVIFLSSMILISLVNVSLATNEKYLVKSELTGWEEVDTYHEIIAYFEILAEDFDQVKMIEMGPTDSGYPLHLVM